MAVHRLWSRRGLFSVRSTSITFATLLSLVTWICGMSRDAKASDGCDAVNMGGFNVSVGVVGNRTIVDFAVGDNVTFTITWRGSGSWLLRTANFTNLFGSPIFATTGSQRKSYIVTGDNQDTTLTQFTIDGLTVMAACAGAAELPTVTSISPTSGPARGGSSVTITGTALTGATSLNFDNNAAYYRVNSDSSITATSPSGTGTVHVTVSTPAGTSPTSAADQFTYTAARGALLVPLPRADPRRRLPRSRPNSIPLKVWRSLGPLSPALPR